MTDFTLDELTAIVRARGRSGDAGSYTAKLLAKGPARVAKKFGEEAVELVIAAVEGDADALTAEAADMLYHFIVLLEARGIALDGVLAELQRRTAQSGLAEKASRPPE